MFLRAAAVWLALMVLAILNGVFRQAVLSPRLGDGAAHVASTVILCLLLLVLSWWTIAWIGPTSLRDAGLVGLTWLAMTVAFEFLAGHYVFGHPWERLLADYNIFAGRVWVLVLVTTALAPAVAFAARGGR